MPYPPRSSAAAIRASLLPLGERQDEGGERFDCAVTWHLATLMLSCGNARLSLDRNPLACAELAA